MRLVYVLSGLGFVYMAAAGIYLSIRLWYEIHRARRWKRNVSTTPRRSHSLGLPNRNAGVPITGNRR